MITGLLVLALAAVLARAQEKPARESFQDLQRDFLTKVREVKTPQARKELYAKYAARFLAFAEKNPRDPAAVNALSMVVQMSSGNLAGNTLAGKALAILRKDHLKSDKVLGVVSYLALLGGEPGAKFVKEVIAKNPSRKVQARAIKELIRARGEQVGWGLKWRDDAARRAAAEKDFGKEFVKRVIANVDNNKKERKEHAKLLKAKYSDIFPDLSIGQKAPEVVSEDLDGKKVRLSDLKGKVVVLDIWASWCPPCWAMLPVQRALLKRLNSVERLKDKFVLVSVSADPRKAKVKQFIADNPMPWTHWYNGNKGGIVEAWDVRVFPTTYVLDARGVIRYKFAGKANEKLLNRAVNNLLGIKDKKNIKK
jgi:peroxiredoxin